MSFTVFHASQLDWIPRDDGSGRAVARLSDSMTQSRANIWPFIYGAPPRGRRNCSRSPTESTL